MLHPLSRFPTRLFIAVLLAATAACGFGGGARAAQAGPETPPSLPGADAAPWRFCPTTLFTRWEPYPFGNEDIYRSFFGSIEIRPDAIVSEVQGHLPAKRHTAPDGTPYFEVLKQPYTAKSLKDRFSPFLAFHYPHRTYPDNGREFCFMEFLDCNTEEDVLKNIQNAGKGHCSVRTYTSYGEWKRIHDKFDH